MPLPISTNLPTSHGMIIQAPSAFPPSDLCGGWTARRESMKRALGGRHPFFSKRLRRMAVDDRSLNLPLPNDLFSLHLSANSGGYRPNQALLSCPPAAEQKTTSSQQGAQHQRESTRLRNSGIGRQIGRQNRGITAALS